MANAIAQAREEAAWLGDAAEGHNGPEEEEDDEEEGLSAMLLFESLRDWEKELQRLGAAGWRVSAVNERFDMAPRYSPIGPPAPSEPLEMAPVIWGTPPCVPPSHSLPQYLWVPTGLLDHDLKRTFAHFQERRVPVSAWAGPGGVGGTGKGTRGRHPVSLAAPVLALPGWGGPAESCQLSPSLRARQRRREVGPRGLGGGLRV